MIQRLFLIVICFLFISNAAMAQNDRTKTVLFFENLGLEYELRAGVNIGGAAPVPLPEEIRSLDGYNPRFNGALEGVATYWWDEKKSWGISLALRLESKGMKTDATVKNYRMEIINDGSRVSGYWTGAVKTTYGGSFLTVPVMLNYKISDRWKIRAGLYLSYCMEGDFTGFVSDGYLREGTPVGEKIEFKDGKTASYDFSTNLRSVLWGIQAGVSWKAFNRFSLNADLSWGFNGIFKSSFKTISFEMYPIYANIGFGYNF